MSAELAEFILARVAEVEQMARDAGGGAWVKPRLIGLNSCIVEGSDITIHHDGGQTAEQASHIAYWDPARALAKCRADRLIVAEHSPWPDEGSDCVGCGLTMHEEPRTPDANRCPVLRSLASQWNDHSDYRPEWAVL